MSETQRILEMQRAFGFGSQNQMLNDCFNGSVENMVNAARRVIEPPRKRKKSQKKRSNPTKPLKWYGGKQRLGKWIVSNFPDRDAYSHYHEVFAGGLGVLFAHTPEGKSESANDINSDLTNFWKVLQNPDLFSQFLWRVKNTPFSAVEWRHAVNYLPEQADVDRACSFFIRYRQSYNGRGGEFCIPTKRSGRRMNENISAWLGAVEGLPHFHERLLRVEIRNMDCVEYIRKLDHEKALFYLDPPYLPETRVRQKAYEFEMPDAKHGELLECLAETKGKFILSGYHSELYDKFLIRKLGCRVEEKQVGNAASSQSTKPKMTEVLWMNY